MMVEAVLRDKDMTILHFSRVYEENRSKTYECRIAYRANFVTNDDETSLVSPKMLQDYIDARLKTMPPGSRAFVRPCDLEDIPNEGEDILRLYVESKTMEDVEKMAEDIVHEI